MGEARQRADWRTTSAIMAMIAETHRDQQRRRRPFEPSEFDPFAPKRLPLTAENIRKIEELKARKAKKSQ